MTMVGKEYVVNVVAKSRCEVYSLARKDLLEMASEHLELAERMELATKILEIIVNNFKTRIWGLRMSVTSKADERGAIGSGSSQLWRQSGVMHGGGVKMNKATVAVSATDEPAREEQPLGPGYSEWLEKHEPFQLFETALKIQLAYMNKQLRRFNRALKQKDKAALSEVFPQLVLGIGHGHVIDSPKSEDTEGWQKTMGEAMKGFEKQMEGVMSELQELKRVDTTAAAPPADVPVDLELLETLTKEVAALKAEVSRPAGRGKK